MSSPSLHQRLGRGDSLRPPRGFKQDLARLAEEVLRAGGDVDYVFVGRSPENVYDFLSGALGDTCWSDRLQLLQLSLFRDTPGRLRRQRPAALSQLWTYFAAMDLTPQQIVARSRPVAFVDLVFAGRTFGNLFRLLRSWTGGEPGRWQQVRDRLRWLCVVERGHPRFEPWTPSLSPWTEQVPQEHVRLIHIDWQLWRYLADDQAKTTASFTVERWNDPARGAAPADEERLKAARFARSLYRLGRWSRARLSAQLARERARHGWVKELARDLESAC